MIRIEEWNPALRLRQGYDGQAGRVCRTLTKETRPEAGFHLKKRIARSSLNHFSRA